MEINLLLDKASFAKKIILLITFFAITPLTLVVCLISLVAISSTESVATITQAEILEYPKPGVQIFASLPSDLPSISAEVIPADARPEIIYNYLAANNSPLAQYSELIVSIADNYELDYRLITAIAQKESGLCRVIPEESYNCWGWGIHSQGTLKFSSFEEGIETVSQGLRKYYIDEGYETVEQIMKKYANPSSTTWAEGVLDYMNQIQ